MTTYFLRRLLLVIPTFLGSTILVFTILQLSPGGPLEKTIQELQTGGGLFGGEGGATSSSISGGTVLPESAMRELKRFYGFDKPIWQRYLTWLGVWPRGIKYRNPLLPSFLDVKSHSGYTLSLFIDLNFWSF